MQQEPQMNVGHLPAAGVEIPQILCERKPFIERKVNHGAKYEQGKEYGRKAGANDSTFEKIGRSLAETSTLCEIQISVVEYQFDHSSSNGLASIPIQKRARSWRIIEAAPR